MHAIRRFTRAVALTAVFIPALWSVSGAAAEGADEAIVSRIEALSSGFPVQVLGDALMAHKALPAFYSGNGYRHAWHSTELREQLAEVIESASDDGLNPEDYHASILSELATRPMSEFSAEHQADIDLLFSDAFLVFGSHLLEGKVNPQTIHAEWTANRRQRQMESVLADALASGDVAATLESLRPANPAYHRLMQARKLLTRVVGEPSGGRVVLESDADLAEIAAAEGEIPLPPYFHGELGDDERYQTVFADRVGSAAAPTAALHFTPEVIEGLARRGVGIARVELEVGLDTFRPISSERVEDHAMHMERIAVAEDAARQVAEARRRGGRVVAIGTTVVRTLESAWSEGEVRPFAGDTDLFITPGHRFRAVDLVVTNFHVPGSTLVVLVAALLGDRWRQVYETALERGYRFLSFGDAMLAEVPR